MPKTRTRIRIGSGGVLYLAITGGILTSAIYTQANLLFLGFGLLVGALVMSIGLAAVALRGIEVRRVVGTHAAAGEPLLLGYEIRNRSWLPAFAVVLRESWAGGTGGAGGAGGAGRAPTAGAQMLGGPPHAWALHVGPGQTVQTQAPCRPRRRGRLRFERIEASTSFPFGVIHKTVVSFQVDEVVVFPRLYRVRRQLLNRLATAEGEGRHQEARPGGTDEFFGLREYRPGDSPRMIDWKRTARTGELAVRELTRARLPSISLVLDLRGACVASELSQERAISLAASLVCDAYLQGFRIGLHVLGTTAPVFAPRHSPLHRTQLLETLAEIDPSREGLDTAGGDTRPRRFDLVVRPGSEDSPPADRADGRNRGPTVLDAAHFDRYVTDTAVLAEFDRQAGRGPGQAEVLAGVPAATGGGR